PAEFALGADSPVAAPGAAKNAEVPAACGVSPPPRDHLGRLVTGLARAPPAGRFAHAVAGEAAPEVDVPVQLLAAGIRDTAVGDLMGLLQRGCQVFHARVDQPNVCTVGSSHHRTSSNRATGHSFTPSSPAVARVRESGETASECGVRVCQRNLARTWV